MRFHQRCLCEHIPASCDASLVQEPLLGCRVAMWNQPTKTYGFWTSDKANAKYHVNLDPAVQRLPGRYYPYEEKTS